GDTPFSSEFTWSMAAGASCNVSRITTSPHNGTHADAPLHFLPGTAGIGDVPLDPYLGPCMVVQGPGEGQILPRHLDGIDLAITPRILVRTHQSTDAGFDREFVSLSAEAAGWLANRGARLIGLDTPSMDPFDSKTMDAHHALLGAGVAILENLVLAHVDPGVYELIALPLRWTGLDASPVRAVLRETSLD
ncbi:MAG: cyclase family protein, partial [Gemmatimonadetes bacterium]|nr:cyclase family protein [Gemmatimonadota bacterium]